MRHRSPTTLAFLLFAAVAACVPACAQQSASQGDPPLSPQQIRALVERVLDNQLRDDAALDRYARTEREVRTDTEKHTTTETLSRIVPLGDGNFRLQLERDGKPTDPADLEQAWRNLAKALAASSNPADPQVRQARDRYEKRQLDREKMVREVGKAFRFRWAGRVRQGDRTLIALEFAPTPGYKSPLRFGRIYAHTRGTVWVDPATSHLVRLDAVLSDDVSFGGFLVKVYRGGRFTLEQIPVAPDVWEPALYTYDFDGRKLFFSANIHERVAVTGYRPFGSPQQALAQIRREHPFLATPDP